MADDPVKVQDPSATALQFQQMMAPQEGSTSTALAPIDPQTFRALDKLNPTQLEQARAIATTLKVNDFNSLIALGDQARKELNGTVSPMLQQIALKDTGPIGKVLSELQDQLKGIDPDAILHPKGFDFFGKLKHTAEHYVQQFQAADKLLERTELELEQHFNQLRVSDSELNDLGNANHQYRQAMLIEMAAGEIFLEQVKAQRQSLGAQASQSNDQELANQVILLDYVTELLENHLFNLAQAAYLSQQKDAQIMMMRQQNSKLAIGIKESIMTQVPLQREMVALGINQYRQQKTTEVLEAQRNATSTMIQKQAEMLHKGAVDIARATTQGIASMESLKASHEHFLATIDEVRQITEDAAKQRQTNLQELERMEQEEQNKRLQIATQATSAPAPVKLLSSH